jgi:integrase
MVRETVRKELTPASVRKLTPPTDGRVYIFDTKPECLCIRVTHTGAKSFVYAGKLKGAPFRITIGATDIWSLDDARKEARRLQTIVDNKLDPRQVKADGLAEAQAARDAKEAAAAALVVQETRDSVTVGNVWPVYVAARTPAWGVLHLRDHVRAMQPGGEQMKFGTKPTAPGPLASLSTVRLIDLTPELITEWAKVEGLTRPTRARLALRLLRAFIFWCAENAMYKGIITGNAAQSKTARESLGKPQKKSDVIQREQLPAWFAAVRQIGNPVISAYLQALLLTGARREELANLKWADVDFQWNSLKLNDKVEEFRMVPLTPYVASLLVDLKRRNDTPPPRYRILNGKKIERDLKNWKPSQWVFSSPAAASGHLADPRIAHNQACAIAGLVMTLHGLRRSFATLCEWTETPSGIAAQIQGHAPQGVREQNYIRRPLDLLRMWHVKIEAWILEEAGIEFVPEKAGLSLVQNTAA